MAETYQFTWGEVPATRRALALGQRLMDHADYAHIERKDFDLDMDQTGIRIRLPHDHRLNEERKTL